MSMQDPIADMFTRIRNAQLVAHPQVAMRFSNIKAAIAQLLVAEGYIRSFKVEENDGKNDIIIDLKYSDGRPVIEEIKRISRPGLRKYSSAEDLPKVRNGLGVAIISTSQGVVSDKVARQSNIGGEVIGVVF